jgi:hypothetical protein
MTHIKIERAKLRKVLDALKRCYDVRDYPADGSTLQDEAIAALKEALAAPVQEPVGKEDIIRMAREAGPLISTPFDVWCERFAALAQAAERNKLAAWMQAQGYATGHGDTIEGLLEELRWQVRDACAVLCDQLSDSSRDLRFGAAIRART